jgi:hypothetical protein
MSAVCVCLPYPVVVVQLYISDGSAQRNNNATQFMQSCPEIKPGNAQERHFWIRQLPPLENTPYIRQTANTAIKELKDDEETVLTHYWAQQISSRQWNAHYTQQAYSIMADIQNGYLTVDKDRSERIIRTLVDTARKIITQKVAAGVMNSRVIDESNRVIMEARDLLYKYKTLPASAVDVWA